MATQPFIPNDADATFTDQAEPDSGHFEILLRGYRRTGVSNASTSCAVTQRGAGANMSVDVAAGTAYVNSSRLTVAAVNKTITTADATNPRWDLISVSSAAVVTVTNGTAAAQPVFPAIPSDNAVLAAVYVPANDTAITDNQILDLRVRLDPDKNYTSRIIARQTFK